MHRDVRLAITVRAIVEMVLSVAPRIPSAASTVTKGKLPAFAPGALGEEQRAGQVIVGTIVRSPF
jgi:hypothetical protein